MNPELLNNLQKINTPEAFWPQINKAAPTPTNNLTTTAQPTPAFNQQNSPVNQNIKNMENCKVIRTITKTIDVAALAAASSYPNVLDFGKEVKRIIGYYVVITSLGGLTSAQIKLGLADNTKTIIDPTMIEHFVVSTSVPIQYRFNKEDPINLNGGALILTIKNDVAFVGAFQCQLIAQCEL